MAYSFEAYRKWYPRVREAKNARRRARYAESRGGLVRKMRYPAQRGAPGSNTCPLCQRSYYAGDCTAVEAV